MWALVLVVAANLDGGSWAVTHSVQRSVVEQPRDAAARVELVTETLVGDTEYGQQERSFSRVSFFLPDGGANAQLATLAAELNGKLTFEDLKDVEATMRAGDFHGTQSVEVSVSLNRMPWLGLEHCGNFVGAYPSTSCEHFQVRVDTGEHWSWADAFEPSFLEACSKRLAQASARKAKELEGEDAVESFGLTPTECTSSMLARANYHDRGLSMTIGTAPHVAQALLWNFELPRAFLLPYVLPEGPLGHLVAKKKK
jgi:hypothetical protein